MHKALESIPQTIKQTHKHAHTKTPQTYQEPNSGLIYNYNYFNHEQHWQYSVLQKKNYTGFYENTEESRWSKKSPWKAQ